MADKKISELTSASLPLAGTEVVSIVQGGETKKVAVSEFGGGTPSLQAVTDVGNTTTNEIIAGNFSSAGSGNFGGIVLNDGDLNQTASLTTLATTINPRDYTLPDKNGTIAIVEDTVAKVSTSGVERAYIINADGSQGIKATIQFGANILLASANNIVSDNTTSGNVVRYTFLVPANTIKKGARMDILARIAKLNPVPTADAFRLYVTNDFSTLNQTQFALLNINGNLNSPFERCLTFDITTGNMFYLSGSTSLNTDNGATTNAYTELTYDVTQDHWFSVFMQVNTSNLMTLRDFKAILTNPLP